jgi:hypothetical protein
MRLSIILPSFMDKSRIPSQSSTFTYFSQNTAISTFTYFSQDTAISSRALSLEAFNNL